MDIWSDPNLRPYMAVTAHWIESFKDGKDEHLRLESALIGFREMPGHHSGEHLSTAFIHILDRLNITDKVSNQKLLFMLLTLCTVVWICYP